MSVQRMYPQQGSKAFETTSLPIVRSFRMSSATGNTATGTWTTEVFPKGSVILGFVGKVTTAFASTGSATLQIGFTGACQLSAATAKTSVDAAGDILGPAATNTAGPYALTADDTFDFIVGTAKFNAGAMDVHVIYVPPPDGTCDSTFKQYALT